MVAIQRRTVFGSTRQRSATSATVSRQPVPSVVVAIPILSSDVPTGDCGADHQRAEATDSGSDQQVRSAGLVPFGHRCRRRAPSERDRSAALPVPGESDGEPTATALVLTSRQRLPSLAGVRARTARYSTKGRQSLRRPQRCGDQREVFFPHEPRIWLTCSHEARGIRGFIGRA